MIVVEGGGGNKEGEMGERERKVRVGEGGREKGGREGRGEEEGLGGLSQALNKYM